jgi:hypothetical protein
VDLALAIALGLGLAGCAGAAAQPAAPTPEAAPMAAPQLGSTEPVELGLVPGETMAFDVHLGGVLSHGSRSVRSARSTATARSS